MAKNFQQAGLSGMSLTGTFAGTPLFMPREQFINFKYVKPVSDVWSLGATFYNMPLSVTWFQGNISSIFNRKHQLN